MRSLGLGQSFPQFSNGKDILDDFIQSRICQDASEMTFSAFDSFAIVLGGGSRMPISKRKPADLA